METKKEEPPTQTRRKPKPPAVKIAPQHIQDRRRERVKDCFTNMGLPDKANESEIGKTLKTGNLPQHPCDVCQVKHRWFQCPVESD